ncbi:tyrosine-type recombinase/integrase [Psychrobacillus sp. NPDC093180]|uniref:tyrosine-type recombinase/integrase n=1 Tax=Psychrobacillus sp. NPDC093180 TaxID=3364489 RepID=UPI003823554F
MASYQKYETKKGQLWLFKIVLQDPGTKEKYPTTRRGFKTQGQAKIAAKKLADENKIANTLQNSNKLYREVYEELYKEQERVLKPPTMKQKKTKFNKWILPHFGDYIIGEIDKKICQDFIDYTASKITTFKDLVIQAKLVFEYAIQNEYIKDSPFKNTVIPINVVANDEDDKDFDGFWERDEINTFLDLLKEHGTLKEYAIYRTLLYSGLRKGELASLMESDLNDATNEISVSKTLYYEKGVHTLLKPKTKNSRRKVDVDQETFDTLKQLVRENRKRRLAENIQVKEKFIFVRDDFRPMRVAYVNERLEALCKKFNLREIKVHGLRHTHASMLFAAGEEMKKVQMRLGHARLETTMNIYTHLTKEETGQTPNLLVDYMQSGEKKKSDGQTVVKKSKTK